jgi:hypothetical protein
MCQQGDDPETVRFREVLNHLRSAEATEADADFLNSRYLQHLPVESRVQFEEALHLCPTKDLVDNINNKQMDESGQPVLMVPARLTGVGANQVQKMGQRDSEERCMVRFGSSAILRCTISYW